MLNAEYYLFNERVQNRLNTRIIASMYDIFQFIFLEGHNGNSILRTLGVSHINFGMCTYINLSTRITLFVGNLLSYRLPFVYIQLLRSKVFGGFREIRSDCKVKVSCVIGSTLVKPELSLPMGEGGTCSQGSTRQPPLVRVRGYFVCCLSVVLARA